MKKILFMIFFIQSAIAAHDFSQATWSNGKSCLVCHDLKNNLPKVYPTDARIIDMTKLSVEENAAYDANPHNLTCLVCHQEKHSTIQPKPILNSGAPSLPAPTTPVYASGSHSSTNIRVINLGINSKDCLNCHDLHNNDSPKLLKSTY